MTFRKTVAAYLTGWLIVQPLYNRVFNYWKKLEMAKPDGEYARHINDMAAGVVRGMRREGLEVQAMPRRGDAVEAWLKYQRDLQQHADSFQWRALDDALDDYRLHADTGSPLRVRDIGP